MSLSICGSPFVAPPLPRTPGRCRTDSSWPTASSGLPRHWCRSCLIPRPPISSSAERSASTPPSACLETMLTLAGSRIRGSAGRYVARPPPLRGTRPLTTACALPGRTRLQLCPAPERQVTELQWSPDGQTEHEHGDQETDHDLHDPPGALARRQPEEQWY